MSKTLWLVGMMGSGKTTVAPMLGERLNLPVRDTDAMIVKKMDLSIADIFEREGEANFRKIEHEIALGPACREGVIALGGGALTQPEIEARVAEGGVSIYLRAAARTLADRVGTGSERPLLKGMSDAQRLQALRKLLDERKAAYERAKIIVDVDAHTPAQVADLIEEKLEDTQVWRQVPARIAVDAGAPAQVADAIKEEFEHRQAWRQAPAKRGTLGTWG